MISAPVVPAQLAALKALLGSMNVTGRPGMADQSNPFIPFAKFAKLHYARFVILDDQTLGDFARIGEPVPDYPVELAFLGDCDGPAGDFLRDLALGADPGLRQIFSHCEGFQPGTNLLDWMQQHKDEVSAECKEFFAKAMETRGEIREAMRACRADAEKLCKDVKPGEGRIVECWQQHKSELSSGCASKIP